MKLLVYVLSQPDKLDPLLAAWRPNEYAEPQFWKAGAWPDTSVISTMLMKSPFSVH